MIGGVTSPNLSRLTGASYLLGKGSASARVLSHYDASGHLRIPRVSLDREEKRQTARNLIKCFFIREFVYLRKSPPPRATEIPRGRGSIHAYKHTYILVFFGVLYQITKVTNNENS